MRGLLAAFGTIWSVAVVGWAISRYGLLGPGGETVLARLAFFVATPALLFDTLATADLGDIFTPALTAFVLSTLGVTGLFFAWARIAGRTPPSELLRPFELVGGAAVPLALLALGMSLNGFRTVAGRTDTTAWYVVVTLKVLIQPLLAYAIGRFVLGLEGRLLLAAVVTSGLPTAQNIFVYAAHYERGTWLARDAVVVSTVLAAVSLIVIAVWLG